MARQMTRQTWSGPIVTVHELELYTDPLPSDQEVFVRVHGREFPVTSLTKCLGRIVLVSNSTKHAELFEEAS